MKLKIFIAFLLALMTHGVSAGCSGNITYQDSMVVNEYFVLNPTQSEVFSHQYNDMSCSGTNTVSPLKPSDIIVGFYDNSVKLKLTITWIDGQDIKLDSSKGVFPASYKVTVSEVSSSTTANISADSSNSVLIKDIASLSSASSTSKNDAFSDLFWCVVFGKGWNTCITNYRNALARVGGFYSSDLRITWNRKQSTCKPQDLSITLPNTSLSELPQSGKSTTSATENIKLQCDNLFGERKQSTRKMTVYLYSSDLITNRNDVLKGDENNAVGFVLESGTKQLTIGVNAGNVSGISSLWEVAKAGYVGSNEVQIPITARYYVLDKSKAKPGDLKATVIIAMKYD